ncbi:hypothetical protein ACJRO7_006875 [Eucalyptus globulus]|uniref:Uncharacterized protein n=1 Tax=Eucalyptus globulus TaxID=34317 RepID=A0ABD3IJ99_EUCGL
MVLPVVKLGTLAVKTFSKPIANRIKKQATHHPKFRQFIINLAQANHRFTTQIQRRIYGRATDVAIRPLNKEKAVQAAVDLAGELFVSSRSEARKEELRRQELEVSSNMKLAREVELLRQRVEELDRLAKGRGLTGIMQTRTTVNESTGPS